MNSFEELIWLTGASWQMSVFLPFVILLFLGLIATYFLFRKVGAKIQKRALIGIIGLLPAALYFAFFPIYHSDLKNDYRKLNLNQYSIPTQSSLEVMTLPNCPYCIESIAAIARLKKRNPKLKIQFKILSSNKHGGHVASLLKKSQINYSFVNNTKNMKKITGGSFPSFAFYEKGQPSIMTWDNNTFGSCALDYIESN